MANLVLACPYCNNRKRTRDVEEFIASGDWRLEPPPGLETEMQRMLRNRFGWDVNDLPEFERALSVETGGEPQLRTSSPHARFVLRSGRALALLRPGRRHPWTSFDIGPEESPATVAASWDYLTRHFTPSAPKEPPHWWLSKKRGGGVVLDGS